MNKSLSKIFIIALFFIALAVRFFFLETVPPALNWDEVSHGYNAFSLLQTGKDEWGNSLPLIFRAFGDYKLPFYIYLTTIPVAIFGLNSFSVRLVSILSGLLAVLGIYLLSKKLFPDKKISIFGQGISLATIASLLLTILPWHFFLSRPALEANLALTLIIYGFYFLINSRQRPAQLFLSALLLGLSLHTYNSARVFVPLMLFATILIYKIKPKTNLVTLASATTISIFIVLFAIQTIRGEGVARYNKVKILSESAVFQIGERRVNSKLPGILPKLIFNRPAYFVETLAQNYFEYYMPSFFTQTNGPQWQFSIPNVNMVTLPLMVLFYTGTALLVFKIKDNPDGQFILTWLVLAPIPASLTADPPQAIRPLFMIPAIVIISAFALWKISEIKKTYTYISILLIILSFVIYLYQYFNIYPKIYSESWQYGTKEAVEYAKQNETKYDKIFFTKKYGEPHIFYLFFNKITPDILQDANQTIRFYQSEWYWIDKIGKYYFLNEKDIPETSVENFTLESKEVIMSKNSLLITSPDHVPQNSKTLKTIYFLDGKVAYIIVSIP